MLKEGEERHQRPLGAQNPGRRCVRELGASAAEIACVGRDQHLLGEPGDNEDGKRGGEQ